MDIQNPPTTLPKGEKTELEIARENLQKAEENERIAKQKAEQLQKNQKYMVKANEIQTDYFNPIVWTQIKGMAEVFAQSGAFPQEMNSSKFVVVLQAGMEMGMKPIEAVKSLYFVKGVLSIYGAATTRRLREHGWTISYKEEANKCEATVKKASTNESYTDTLTFDEAVKSGWTRGTSGSLKPGWMEGVNRKLKLRYGVLSMIIKTYIPEVLGAASDIAEIAEDMAPVISGEVAPPKTMLVAGGEDPAEKNQLETIEKLMSALGFEKDGTKKYTKNEAANTIKELTLEVMKKKQAEKKEEKKEEKKGGKE